MSAALGWPWHQTTPATPLRWAGVALLYGLVCGLSLWMAGQTGHVATLWFASPVGAVALMKAPRASWPALLVALGVANAAANWGHQVIMLGTLFNPGPVESWVLWSALAFVPGNLVEMALSAWALRRWCVDPGVLGNPWALARVLLVGGVLPVLPSSVAGATILHALHQGPWGSYFSTWLAGSVIGTVAVLPLALVVGLQGSAAVLASLRQARNLGMVLGCLSLAVLALTSLPFPFVAISLLMALLSLVAGFPTMAFTTVLVGLLQGILIRQGVLLAPPSTLWWGDALFYLAVLESLLPGVLLSAAISGREVIIARLRQSEQRLRSLYVETPVMLHSVDPQGRIEQVSRHWLDKFGYREEEVIGRPLTAFVEPDSVAALATAEATVHMRHRDGRRVDVVMSSIWEFDEQGRAIRRLAVLQDVTERNRLAQRSHYAEHDPLTGLPNRLVLQDRLNQACEHAALSGRAFGLGFMDLDGFKQVNDAHGHEAGDELLRQVAQRLLAHLRASDMVYRLAGDEFVLWFADQRSAETLQDAAMRVLTQLNDQPYHLVLPDGSSESIQLSASMGVALYGLHGHEPAALMQQADAAMYRAKRLGSERSIAAGPGADTLRNSRLEVAD